MINYCSNVWASMIDWKQEISERSSEWLDHNWNYYIQERAIFHGLPIAIISSIAAAYLFNCAKPMTGAIFGLVNYITLTSLLEIIREHDEIDKTKACVILGMSGAISFAFIQTVCKTSLTYQAAAGLAIAAFAGQLSRIFFMNEEY